MLASRVLPAAALVRASRCRTSALIRLDLPTSDRPTRAISAAPSRGKSSTLAALRTKLASAFMARANGEWLWTMAAPSTLCHQPSAMSHDGSVRNGVVDDVHGLGLRRGGEAPRHRLGPRNLQDLV